MAWQKETIEREFPELQSIDDYRAYKRVTEVLRAFEQNVVYNFLNSDSNRRQFLADPANGLLRQALLHAYQLFRQINWDCPDCPDPDDCTTCPPYQIQVISRNRIA